VDKQVAHRFAELVGHGLTQHEAAGAVGIGTRTGERLMTKPEIRQVVEQTTAGDGDPTIRALLEATDEAGKRQGAASGLDRRLPAPAVGAPTRQTERLATLLQGR
jgi:hypothetical protein